MKSITIDVETFSSVDITKSGVYRYCEFPDFEILLFACVPLRRKSVLSFRQAPSAEFCRTAVIWETIFIRLSLMKKPILELYRKGNDV